MEPWLIVAVGMVLIAGVGWFRYRLALVLSQNAALQHTLTSREKELEQLRTQWHVLLEAVQEGILLIEPNQHVLTSNEAARVFLDLKDIPARSVCDIAWGFNLEPVVQPVLAGKTALLAQMVVKDERTFQVSIHAVPLGARIHAFVILTEVTELQRLGRSRRDLVANISHDLRTPVTNLNLLAETLSNELPADSLVAAQLLPKLRGQIDLLSQLANEMLDLALIESGQMPLKLMNVRADELVQDALRLVRPQAERKGLVLGVALPPELRVWADPAGVRKVLNNLLHNAIKFTPAGGQIRLSARRLDDNVEVSVADTGIGIPARDLPRIFERFYKVDRVRTPSETRGTGLGLAIAKHLIEGHGGKIWAESVEGKGSTLYFTLPVVD
jgi:two-component system, OmpR family, phosphate regulon sensor histidine kinase PhoR